MWIGGGGYASPHVVRCNERNRVAAADGGQLVEDEQRTDALERAERANDGAPITFFEITTAAAFLLFSEMPAEVLLLETGLGGRLDATNVVDDPLVSVIPPIGLDHQRFLGHTVEAIAEEKAGLLKRDRPVVAAPHASPTPAVIELSPRSRPPPPPPLAPV